MDTDKAYSKKAWRQFHKNAASCIGQVLESASHKTAVVWTQITHFEIHPNETSKRCGHSSRSMSKLISEVLLLAPSHRWARVGRLARTYLQQFFTDTGCSMEDLPRAMDDRDEWWERVREICASGTPWWWWMRLHTVSILLCNIRISVPHLPIVWNV